MSRSSFARGIAALLSLASMHAPAAAQFAQSGQFAPPAVPVPVLRDRVEGEWVNLETELIEPILWIPGSGNVPDRIAVCNEPDDRVVFLDSGLGLVGEVFVGAGPASLAKNPDAPELWVSVRNQSSIVVIDLATLQVIDLVRRDWQPGNMGTGSDIGIGSSAAPGGIAFSNGHAFVAATQSDELLVFDAAAPRDFVTSIPLSAMHNGQAVRLNDPFAVSSFGGRIWVTSHLSGNNTTSRIAGGVDLEDGESTPQDPSDDVGPEMLGPPHVSIVKLGGGAFTGLNLPDFDVVAVDPGSFAIVGMVRSVGTVLFDVEGNPITGQLVVPNLEARNGDFVGESAFPDGRVTFNRLTAINPSTLKVVGTPTLTELMAGGTTVVMPTDAEISATGRLFVAGYCSANVGVWNSAGAFQGAIPTGSGPRGVTLSPTLARLYVLNRGDNSVQWFDVSNATTVPTIAGRTVSLVDPTPTRVKAGRQIFLEPNSALATANCASCHIDARFDGVAWNLSKTLAEDPSGENPIQFRDRKGVMVTQSLAQLSGSDPFHWRGEQESLESFNGAFVALLKGGELDDPELALMKEYLFSIQLPPNPRQPMNRMLTTSSAGGQAVFAEQCFVCHTLPLGTNTDLTEGIAGDDVMPLTMETAQLRGLWLRDSDEADIDRTAAVEHVRVTGFGLAHEGVIDDLDQFVTEGFPFIVAGHDDVVDFVNRLDSGNAPATLFSELLDASTANTSHARAIEQYLLVQADQGWCDAAARGLLDDGAGLLPVGLVWRPASGVNPGFFETDDKNGTTPVTWTFAALEAKAAAGEAKLLFVGAPIRSGERIGVDRDRDGLFDRDEAQAGTLAASPDSDRDGMFDGYDLQPTVQGAGAPVGAPSVVAGSVRLIYATTNSIKLTYETDQLSPTIVHFGTSAASLPWIAGDGLQPTGTGTTNHWKRRHTVFLAPQPLATPPLLRLEPGKPHFVRIETQGQNGATNPGVVTSSADIGWFYGTAIESIDDNIFTVFPQLVGIGVNYRASQLAFTVNQAGSSPGTFDYTVRATVTNTFGSVALAGLVLPGRFTLYSTDDTYTTVAVQATVVFDGGTGTYVADFAVDDLAAAGHATGKRVTFDLPMWADVPQPGGGSLKIGFPTGNPFDPLTPSDPSDDVFLKGSWSDSESHVETVAG